MKNNGDPVRRHGPGDPEAARVAVDRAFVDAVRGIRDDVRDPYGEALRTHRLACALASSAAAGAPVRLAGARLGPRDEIYVGYRAPAGQRAR